METFDYDAAVSAWAQKRITVYSTYTVEMHVMKQTLESYHTPIINLP